MQSDEDKGIQIVHQGQFFEALEIEGRQDRQEVHQVDARSGRLADDDDDGTTRGASCAASLSCQLRL